MKPSEAVKPISHLKAHASEVIRELSENQGTVIITHNGVAKAVLLDVRAYEQLQDSLALLKILSQSKKSVREGRARPVAEAFRSVRSQLKT